MKKRYKILSIVLALVLAVGTFIVSFADSAKSDTNTYELNVLDYFGSNKKVVFVGDSFTMGCGSTGIINYSTTDESTGITYSVLGNGPEGGDSEDYEVGTKLYTLDNKIWYEAIDGNGWAQLLKSDLENKYGCTVKNYGISGITSGTLLSQTMNSTNSGLIGDTNFVTGTILNTEDAWTSGDIGTSGELYTNTNAVRTAEFIELNSYTDNVVVTSDNVKFKVVYYDDNGDYVAYDTAGWTTGPLTLDKSIGSKAHIKLYTADISDYSKVTVNTVREEENIRVIEGLTNGFDTVFLTIGGNDRGYVDIIDETTGEVTMTAEQQFTANLDKLVDYLITANKKVVLMSMTPCADDDEKSMSMEVIDGLIEDVATEYDVPFVSCYNGMLNYCEENEVDITTLRRADGLHPNDKGYAVVEEIILSTLGISVDNSNLDTTKDVSFELTCDKEGFEFTVYKVADLVTTETPYSVKYESLISSLESAILNGDTDSLLSALDEVPASELTEVVGTYNSDTDGASKLFENLEQGIYYVRTTTFPAEIQSITNSVFALPYYSESGEWTYEIDPIPLATKVDEFTPEIVKEITNSSKDNVNFTDVSLGDTVEFEITASRVGSYDTVEAADLRLNGYVVSDIMECGLTLNENSFTVTLEDADGNIVATLEDTTDYVVDVIANEGVDTTFTVSLTNEYLQEEEFYTATNVVISYSAVLNKYATKEFDGNYNEATNLTYTNKSNVSATVEGNTVYAYTFGIEVNKYDDAGTPLAGSEFGLYLTEDDAKAMANAIATGTSTETGKVEFYTESDEVISLQSGTYYIVETKATESYNRYTSVIPVTINVEYNDTEINGTYIKSAPENGIQIVEVKNTKYLIPNTGGNGAMITYIIAFAFAMLAVTLYIFKKKSSKKATDC